jgi:multiple sugar transport system substrate-binding protein
MTMFKRVLTIAAAALLLFSMTACTSTEDASSKSSVDNSERLAKIAAEPATISFLAPGYDGTDEKSVYFRAIKRLKDEYDKNVEIIQAVGEQLWNEKVAAQIAAKDPVDLFYISVDQYLTMFQKNYIQPVNDYIDLSKPGHNIDVMDDFVKFNGKYYAGGVSATAYVMYYNRDILAAAGYDPDEPKKLYEAGKWTWDKMVEIARETTDSETGIMGLENMFDEAFLATNATSAVKIGDNNKYVLNIDTPSMRHTLELIKDIFYTNVVSGAGYVTGQNKFLKGKAAMHGAYAYEEATFAELKKAGSINIDFGVTAFPVGPDNPEKKNYAHSTGFAISTGSDAPYTSGMLLDLIAEEFQKDGTKNEALLMEGSQELYDNLAKNIFVPQYTDGILERGFGAFYLLYAVRQGEDINQQIDTFKTTYQKFVDEANSYIK